MIKWEEVDWPEGTPIPEGVQELVELGNSLDELAAKLTVLRALIHSQIPQNYIGGDI